MLTLPMNRVCFTVSSSDSRPRRRALANDTIACTEKPMMVPALERDVLHRPLRGG